MNWPIRQQTDGSSTSQYEVDQAVLALVNSAKDPHLIISTCTGGLINFQRPLTLVSISEDGIQSPLVYNLGMFCYVTLLKTVALRKY